MLRILAIIVVVACTAAPLAAAAEGQPLGARCLCRAPGPRVHLGERACIQTPEGPRVAVCSKNQNVMSWQVQQEGCVLAANAKRAA